MPTARHMCRADTLLPHICAIHTRPIWYLAQVLAQPYHRIHGQRRYHCDLFVVWQYAGLLCLLPGFTVMSFLLWLSPHGFSQSCWVDRWVQGVVFVTCKPLGGVMRGACAAYML